MFFKLMNNNKPCYSNENIMKVYILLIKQSMSHVFTFMQKKLFHISQYIMETQINVKYIVTNIAYLKEKKSIKRNILNEAKILYDQLIATNLTKINNKSV